ERWSAPSAGSDPMTVLALAAAHTAARTAVHAAQAQPAHAAPSLQAAQSVDWLAISPPAVAAVAGLAVLVADLFLPERRKRLLGSLSAVALLLSAVPLFVLHFGSGHVRTFCLSAIPHACSYYADT